MNADDQSPTGPMSGGVGNIDRGAWWDPRNWSAGGQPLIGGGPNAASAPKAGWSPYTASTPKAQAGGMAPGLGTSTSEQTNKDAADARQKQLDDFFTELNKPLDFSDPYVNSILTNARNTSMQSSNNAGIFGPYSQNQADQAYIKGAAGLQDAKQARALQALGMSTGQFNNQRDFNYDVSKDKYANDMDLWKFNQDKNSGLGGMIGGGLGALGGAIPGIATLNPSLAFAGASAGWNVGSSIGKGIGGSGAAPPPTFKPGGY